MKTKNLSLFIVGVFAFVFFMNFTSAAVFEIVKVSSPTSVANNATTFNVVYNVTYTGALPSITVNFDDSTITHGTATIDAPDEITLNKDETKQLTAVVTFTSGQTGTIDGTIIATPSSGTPESFTFSVQLTTNGTPSDEFKFCEWDDGIASNPGDIKISIKDFTINGFGEDNEWLPFDEIEVEIDVENNGDDDVDDISVEWGLYDENTDDWVIEPDEIDEISLSDGDEETLTVKFTLDDDMDEDLADLEDGENYVLYVRATGDVDNDNNDPTCGSDSETISMVIEKEFAIVNNFDIPEVIQCGAEFEVSGDVWNVGSKDLDELSLRIKNSDLKIDKLVEVGDVDSLDKESFSAVLNIPKDASEKTYTLTFEVYNEDDDILQGDFDDQESIFTQQLKVEGSCSTSPSGQLTKPTVSAELVSGGQAGKQLVVKGTIKNNGAASSTYTVSSINHGAWAKLVSVQPSSITLLPGKSADVLFTFDVNKGVSGDQTFSIEVIYGDEASVNQPVSVSIEKGASGISQMFGDNWYIWLIGLLNLILVIVIIIVAVRVSRK